MSEQPASREGHLVGKVLAGLVVLLLCTVIVGAVVLVSAGTLRALLWLFNG